MKARKAPTTLAVFTYLDTLRASGATNMYGAPDYVVRHFRISREEAVNFWGCWRDTFSHDIPVKDRAKAAEAGGMKTAFKAQPVRGRP